MKSKRWIVLWIVLSVAVLLACGGGDITPKAPTESPTEPTTAAPSEPTTTPTPSPTPDPAVEDPKKRPVSLEIINESGQAVGYVYISPSDAEDWGNDWLGNVVIPDGERHSITGIPVGVYDIRVANESGDTLEELWEVKIEKDMQWALDPRAALEIVNAGSVEITGLYIADSESDTWGTDWLDGATISPDARHTIEGITSGIYDFRADDVDGNSIESVYAVDMAFGYTWEVTGKAILPSGAVLRFEDDFSDNRNNWGATAESDTVHYIPPTDGEYCILIKSSHLTAWEWYEPFRPDEFVAEVACDIPEGEASCGLGFGPDGDNLIWFEVSPYDQTYALFLLQDSTWQDSLIGWSESQNIQPQGRNYLSLERVQGVMSVFVNGVQLAEVESDLFPTGRIGIGGATYDQENVTVCLDNLKVWRIE